MREQEQSRRNRGRHMENRGHDPPDTPEKGSAPPGGKARPSAATESPPLCREAEGIRAWLKQVRFKKAAFGGVDEADVWKKIGELNTLYEQALSAERMRYDALLDERIKSVSKQLAAQMLAVRPKEAGDVSYE